MKIAVLSPIAWRTPPRRYGPWEQVASNVAEGLVARGYDVTLFATADSITQGKLSAVVEKGYAATPGVDVKVLEYLHISHALEHASEFDIIHNHFDFMPLAYARLIDTPMLTTIHGFSSPKIIPIYQRQNDIAHYVSISDADRSDLLHYVATVYNGIDEKQFTYQENSEDYLLSFSRIHPDKGIWDAIQIAKKAKRRLLIAGLIQDQHYFETKIAPCIDNQQVIYIGNANPTQRNELLGKAFALLHPIHFEEPFGLSVAEAMLCGTPVVAYRRGAMPELIQHGETGFLVYNIEEAANMINKIPTISRAKTYQHALDHFTLDQMVERYLQVYEQVLASHSQRR